MATQAKYDVCRSVFDEETDRYQSLNDRAKTYLSVLTLYSGILLAKASDAIKLVKGNLPATILFYALVLCILATLVTLVLALRMRPYERIFTISQVPDQLEDPATDDDFYDHRIADLAIALDVNYAQNDDFANWLGYSSWLLAASVGINMVLVAAVVLDWK